MFYWNFCLYYFKVVKTVVYQNR